MNRVEKYLIREFYEKLSAAASDAELKRAEWEDKTIEARDKERDDPTDYNTHNYQEIVKSHIRAISKENTLRMVNEWFTELKEVLEECETSQRK